MYVPVAYFAVLIVMGVEQGVRALGVLVLVRALPEYCVFTNRAAYTVSRSVSRSVNQTNI